MRILEKSDRIKDIENKFNASIKDLFYQMHWLEDMRHRDIGLLLNVPRATTTKWFSRFQVPTQSCRRFTDKNLTSWLYKTGRLNKKLRYCGPDRRLQRTKGNVNIDFFKKWSPEMAYVLGFFAADGGMLINSGGSKYIQFVSTDKEILIKIRKILHSNHKIGIKKKNKNALGWKTCYLMQIGSKEIYADLLALGFTPNKDMTLRLPKIPDVYFCHFVRGYFDGDGSISFGNYKRKARKNKNTFYILVSFISGSKDFLRKLSQRLAQLTGLGFGYLGRKSNNSGYQLSYSINDAKILFRYMYGSLHSVIDYCLERKYNKFKQAFNFRGRSSAS